MLTDNCGMYGKYGLKTSPYMLSGEEIKISRLKHSQDECEVHGPCMNGVFHSVVVNKVNLHKWLDKDLLVQEAFPHLTPNEREYLMTGTCCAPFWDDDEDDF